jgi:hypothetical protein
MGKKKKILIGHLTVLLKIYYIYQKIIIMAVSLGVALFLIIGLMAFWCLTFVLGFAVPYWLTIGAVEMLRPKRLSDKK